MREQKKGKRARSEQKVLKDKEKRRKREQRRGREEGLGGLVLRAISKTYGAPPMI